MEQKIQNDPFPGLEDLMANWKLPPFKKGSARRRFREINENLLQLIKNTPPPCFLLGSVLDFMDRVNEASILNEKLTFQDFEFFLNQYADLDEEENRKVRGQVVGKYLPRQAFQNLFPIGMNRVFAGSHFVAAHLAPDVDTMVASFIGWLDAFAARVSEGMHYWCLPGGPPQSPTSQIFKDFLNPAFFDLAARQTATLSVGARDLVHQQGLQKEAGAVSINTIDHGVNEKSVVSVDEAGHYRGDWRSSDVESVRQVALLFKSCLRWFENTVQGGLITLFAKEKVSAADVTHFTHSLFQIRMETCEPIKELSSSEKKNLQRFFQDVLALPNGMQASFEELAQQKFPALAHFQVRLNALDKADFNHRPSLFKDLGTVIHALDKAIDTMRTYIERLDVSLAIKDKVLETPPLYITLKSDVEEIRTKMGTHDSLTVLVPEENGAFFPVGIVRREDLQKPFLGTVSFRDFCNLEEVKMAPYLAVVSVIDHHKTSLQTVLAPFALIGDAQSSNTLVAEQAFRHIDRVQEAPYYVHAEREKLDYFLFLHAILDDTDLLTKVTTLDIEIVMDLLNRLKRLTGSSHPPLSLQGISYGPSFTEQASQRILRDPDMYALYSQLHRSRQEEMEKGLKMALKGDSLSLFQDTKEQNRCCRIGQIKLFPSLLPLFDRAHEAIQTLWQKKVEDIYKRRPEMDLHLMMVSTIPTADELFKGDASPTPHLDELWVWIPPTQLAQEHLSSFLNQFRASQGGRIDFHLVLKGHSGPLEETFARNWPTLPPQREDGHEQIAILRYKAGSLNSRKAMISPYLPKT